MLSKTSDSLKYLIAIYWISCEGRTKYYQMIHCSWHIHLLYVSFLEGWDEPDTMHSLVLRNGSLVFQRTYPWVLMMFILLYKNIDSSIHLMRMVENQLNQVIKRMWIHTTSKFLMFYLEINSKKIRIVSFHRRMIANSLFSLIHKSKVVGFFLASTFWIEVVIVVSST